MAEDDSNYCLGFVLATLCNLLQAISAGAVQVMHDRVPEFELNIFRYLFKHCSVVDSLEQWWTNPNPHWDLNGD